MCVSLASFGQKRTQAPVDLELPSVLIETPPSSTGFLDSLNAGVTLIGAHDSAAGWYTVMTPAAAYTYKRFSADLSFPLYLYRLAQSQTQTQGPPSAPGQPLPPTSTTTTPLAAQTFDPGDLFLALHANFSGQRFFSTLTPSMTIPTGDSDHGLSTGRVTFDFDDYSQLRLPRSALILDLGAGDSSSLVDPLVTRNYSSLGPLAHFQFGAQVVMPFHATFQSLAYEQLPLGDTKVYTTLTRPGYPDRTVISGRSVSEDNGFASSIGIPLRSNLSFQAYYNRSLRLKLDTVGFGFSYALRGVSRNATSIR